MTEHTSIPQQLRASAMTRKQVTIDRLRQAIAQLETDHRPVNTFTIKEVSGLNYMSYYRNREAFVLFQQHSTHLREERERAQARLQASPSKGRKQRKDVPIVSTVKQRDPLLDYKKTRLVALLREARQACEQVRQDEETKYRELEQRYQALLLEHMQCGLSIARLEAKLTEHTAFLERFRTSLQQEEHRQS